VEVCRSRKTARYKPLHRLEASRRGDAKLSHSPNHEGLRFKRRNSVTGSSIRVSAGLLSHHFDFQYEA
jgi:hypothetical protein